MIRLDADQILYIESRGHTIIYHTEIGEYAERGSLKSAEESSRRGITISATTAIW